MNINIPNFFKYNLYSKKEKIGTATGPCKWAIRKSLALLLNEDKIIVKFSGFNWK